MELKEGMYVRTKYGISQYKYYATTSNEKLLCIPVKDGSIVDFANIEDILKASYNIIDLIEVGDYVNGEKVEEVILDNKMSRIKTTECSTYFEEDIYSIVTSQQFESMSYKVGD